MKVSDFRYELPEELIAQHPPAQRGDSRLLVMDKQTGHLAHRQYKDVIEYTRPGDLVVLNNTKVIKARLIAKNNRGRTRELLLLEDHHNTDFLRRKVLYRGKIHANEELTVGTVPIKVETINEGGIAEVAASVDLLDLAEKAGTVPLPPYMHREATAKDTKRYQTVFARDPGSVAAPTASLNFTHKLEHKLQASGVELAYLTLHVGLGTFLPIRSDDVESHHMHSEYFEISASTVEAIQKTKKSGGRVFAIGTTVTRTLEYCAGQILSPIPQNLSGEADIFIYPGYEFKVLDALLTNFHAPKTTVLMLAAAFAGWDNLKHAYDEAVTEKYAFLSYGDSMLII